MEQGGDTDEVSPLRRLSGGGPAWSEPEIDLDGDLSNATRLHDVLHSQQRRRQKRHSRAVSPPSPLLLTSASSTSSVSTEASASLSHRLVQRESTVPPSQPVSPQG